MDGCDEYRCCVSSGSKVMNLPCGTCYTNTSFSLSLPLIHILRGFGGLFLVVWVVFVAFRGAKGRKRGVIPKIK